VAGIAGRTSRRHARGDHERHAAHARIQAPFREPRDRRGGRVPENRAGATRACAHAGAGAAALESPMEDVMKKSLLPVRCLRFVARGVAPRFRVAGADADVLLRGSVAWAAGEPMGGVTVSAKADGTTITTTVFTDDSGRYYFPPLANGAYRVWAQALG